MNAESYCSSCYRSMPERRSSCAFCAEERLRAAPGARWSLILGAAGAPLLIFGLLAFNTDLCFLGGLIAGSGALLHVIALMR